MAGNEIKRYRASIVGASGYVGGELLRLLLQHPAIDLGQVTSRRSAGSYVHFTHPNLRGLNLRAQARHEFCSSEELESCDLLFLCLPHGQSMEQIERWQSLAPRIVDLSADFRLRSPELFERWYDRAHAVPEALDSFVYGLPELNREEISGASLVSGVGCNATATNLALLPFLSEPGRELIDWQRGITVDLKVGSSEGGNSSSDASHHPIRKGVVRSFAPTGHRHTAEVLQALSQHEIESEVHLSATAIDMVRGVLATGQLFVREGVSEKDLFRAYRQRLKAEPFVRLVKEKTGLYRYPEPKILSGSNFAEIGFALDAESRRLVVLGAIDNLMKGAAGSAVQSMNLMLGLDETSGLDFPGLHPI